MKKLPDKAQITFYIEAMVMQVKDALLTGDLAEGKVIAGDEGVSRVIESIEVMEVPEVASWITPGILIMTTFYSVKGEPSKQVQIVQTLIDKEAAGIVIKLGRFIDTIPEEMVVLANAHAFPIIILPEYVSYINVLTPLYEILYQEKQAAEEQAEQPFSELIDMDPATLFEAIEKISSIVHSPVYIEDSEGSLLYVSEEFRADGWRNSISLFSKPDYPSYTQILESWRMDFLEKSYSVFKIQGFRDRVVLPLITRGKMFAIVHILYKDQSILHNVSDPHINQVGSKLSELFMSEQLYLQKMRLNDMERLETTVTNLNERQDHTFVTVLHFQASWSETSVYPDLYFIDHSCLIREKITQLLGELTHSDFIIFEKYHRFYALVFGADQQHAEMLGRLKEIVAHYNQRNPAELLKVAVSFGIKNADSFYKATRSVASIMDTGRKLRPDEQVYTQDQMGIYEILIDLTQYGFVQDYVDRILFPLSLTLRETLRVYLNEKGNVSKTAEKLFIHRRTLNYRLQKVEEILGMDVDHAENRFILHFCFLIQQLT